MFTENDFRFREPQLEYFVLYYFNLGTHRFLDSASE